MISGPMKIAARALTELDLLAWLSQAQARDVLIYHRGLLAADRGSLPNRDLNRLAKRALWAAELGLVDLVQQRHGPEDASYLAIARRHSTSLSSLIGTPLP